jgi:hypothetical protein
MLFEEHLRRPLRALEQAGFGGRSDKRRRGLLHPGLRQTSGDLLTTTSVQAQHAHNLLRLARVNAALSAWEEYEANALLPPDQRRPLLRPKLTRGGLKELQLMLVQRIGELEELFERG